MKQPTKDALRDQLALAADEIIRLRDDLAVTLHCTAVERKCAADYITHLERPWWRRWFA